MPQWPIIDRKRSIQGSLLRGFPPTAPVREDLAGHARRGKCPRRLPNRLRRRHAVHPRAGSAVGERLVPAALSRSEGARSTFRVLAIRLDLAQHGSRRSSDRRRSDRRQGSPPSVDDALDDCVSFALLAPFLALRYMIRPSSCAGAGKPCSVPTASIGRPFLLLADDRPPSASLVSLIFARGSSGHGTKSSSAGRVRSIEPMRDNGDHLRVSWM